MVESVRNRYPLADFDSPAFKNGSSGFHVANRGARGEEGVERKLCIICLKVPQLARKFFGRP